ncbi:MAG: YcjX family protein [Hyphomicrobiales bacterium]|nr:YcjX family protein [Hyphomicrobiales bacterium]
MVGLILDDIAGLIRSAEDYASELITPPLRLGVTGLARSGKTVFITALVHNLVSGGRLPFFQPAAQRRLIRAYLEPQPDDSVPRFPYEKHLETLTGSPPRWPESTDRISQLRLTLEFEPTALIRRQFGTAALHLDITDYPGEWLLDLSLLRMSYESWSAESLALSHMRQRLQVANDWHAFLGSVDPDADEDEALAITGAELFSGYLRKCRMESHLIPALSPGRLLMPGDLKDSPALTFMPLNLAPGAESRKGSFHAMMARRFEAYKTHVVKPFFIHHFSRLERQIVLVDALGTMNAGSAAIADLEKALASVLTCFRPGPNSWLSLILGKKIDRILFAATKADHIHHTSHQRLEAIMAELVRKASIHAQMSGAEVQAAAVAAVRATREMEARDIGRTMPCIAGVPLPGQTLDGRMLEDGQEVALFPGDLPELSELSESGAAKAIEDASIEFLRFQPPIMTAEGFGAAPVLPHIRLDRALQFLLGDKLE